MKKWGYSLSTNTIWTSFDYGEVKAETAEEARQLAEAELKAKLGRINNVLLNNPETTNEVIEMNFDDIEIKGIVPVLVAKLVYFSFVTRVVVPEDWDDENTAEAAKGGLLAKINNDELYENLEKIIDDIEFPASKENGECYPEI